MSRSRSRSPATIRAASAVAQVWGAVAQQDQQESQEAQLDAIVAAVAHLAPRSLAVEHVLRVRLEEAWDARRLFLLGVERAPAAALPRMNGLAMRIELAIADARAGEPAEVAGEPPVAPPQSTQTAEEEATPQTEEWQQASSPSGSAVWRWWFCFAAACSRRAVAPARVGRRVGC